uniref:Uncharacterized protein n=1 Tax=Romanomermis culicivorax TaxID=13658 RepID=A0A915L1A9_ROMCU
MVDGFSVEDQKLNHLINDIIADLSILDRLGDRLREKSRKNHQSPVQLAMRCLVENERDDVNFCQDLTLSNLQNYEEFCSDLRNLDQFLTKNLSILKDEKSGNLNFKFRQYLLNGNFDDLKNLLDDSPNLDVNFSFDGCSVNRQDGVGQTALSIAVRNGHICQTEILLKNGADPNLLNNMNENALFTLISAIKSQEPQLINAVRYCPAEKICDILDLLLDRGFGNLYARNVYGQKIGTVVRETGRENLLLEQNFHLYFKQTFDMKYALSKNVQILQLRYHKLNNKSSDYLSVQFKISDIWVPENPVIAIFRIRTPKSGPGSDRSLELSGSESDHCNFPNPDYAPWLFLAVAENNAAGNGTKFSPTKNFLNADVFLNGVRLEAVSKFTKDILWFNVSYGMNKLDFHFEIKTDEPITVAFQANVVRYNA